MDRKLKLRVINKLLDAGFDEEKKIVGFGMRDMLVCDVRGEEIGVVLELQNAVKGHKVISFLAGDKPDEEVEEVPESVEVSEQESNDEEYGGGYYE